MIKLLQQNTKKPQNEYWEVASFETQGKRSTMEDRCIIEQGFSGDMSVLVGIFDGHSGSRCSQYLSDELPIQIKTHPQFREEILKAIHDAFLNVDQKWIEQAKSQNMLEDGSTALCILINNDELIVANTGDCRAIMYQGGDTVVLSKDHRAGDMEEETRIVQLGGSVIGGRLQGALEVSRSFGDFKFKENDQKYLTAEPEIRIFPITPETDFIVIGCDGLYEEWQNDDIIQFVKKRFEQKESIQNIVQAMVNEAIDRGSTDNVTGIIVKLKKSYSKILHSGKFRTKKTSSSMPTSLKEKSKSKDRVNTTSQELEEVIVHNSKKEKRKSLKERSENLGFIKKRNPSTSTISFTSTTTPTSTNTVTTTTNSIDSFSKKGKEGLSKSEFISKKSDTEEKHNRARSQNSSPSKSQLKQYSQKNKITDPTQFEITGKPKVFPNSENNVSQMTPVDEKEREWGVFSNSV